RFGSMKSRIDSPLPGSATRRMATVTISAPDSSIASRITSFVEYLPVPTIRRELKSLPPSTRLVSYICLPSAHRPNDFDLVPLGKFHGPVLALRRDLAIDRHRGVLALDVERVQQPVDGDAGLHLRGLPVDRDLHKHARPLPS